jgi:hypothetical protein
VDAKASGVMVWCKNQTHARSSTALSTHSTVGGKRRRKMQIKYEKEAGVILYFPPNELKVVVGILKALHKVCGADFILTAINDIENDLKPKQLPMINYFHLCKNCGRDIDERHENTMCITRDGDAMWQCRVCKPLKENRP